MNFINCFEFSLFSVMFSINCLEENEYLRNKINELEGNGSNFEQKKEFKKLQKRDVIKSEKLSPTTKEKLSVLLPIQSLKDDFDSLFEDSKIKVNKEPLAINEVVRNKNKRKNLPGHTCPQCEDFYNAIDKTYFTESQKTDLVNKCSRHRYKFAVPNTPDHYWSLPSLSSPVTSQNIFDATQT